MKSNGMFVKHRKWSRERFRLTNPHAPTLAFKFPNRVKMPPRICSLASPETLNFWCFCDDTLIVLTLVESEGTEEPRVFNIVQSIVTLLLDPTLH